MKHLIRLFVNFYLYSSLHISVVSVFFVLETYILFKLPIDHVYLAIIFFSTLLVYSIHRIIGIKSLYKNIDEGRFRTIHKYKNHIVFYAVVSALILCCLLWFTDKRSILLIWIAAVISGLYILPVFHEGKRLRDFHFIKIVLIAISWSYISIIPLLATESLINISLTTLVVLGLEKFLFILAITLPFDIRDLNVDKFSNVKTVPQAIGVSYTYRMAYVMLLICWLIWLPLILLLKENYIAVLPFVSLAMVLSICAIRISENKKSDYYFTGMLDGIIALRSIIIIIGLTL